MDVVFRVDGTARTGAGHVMRCLALASAVRRDGGTATFAGTYVSAIARRLADGGMRVVECDGVDAGPLVRYARATASGEAPWVALDGYDFGVDMQRAIRAAGHRLLVIDDSADLPAYDADVILNQNIHAPALRYRANASATLLLGTRYVLLRPEFTGAPPMRRSAPGFASKVLVTFGGADPAGLTARVARILLADPALDPLFVLGPAAAGDIDIPAERIRRAPHAMRPLMEWADLALVAAGSTVWELAYLGVPMITFVVAENQRPVSAGLAGAGASVDLGDAAAVSDADILARVQALAADASRRADMAQCGAALVDGGGSLRTLAALRAQGAHD